MEKRYESIIHLLPEIFYSITITDDPLSGTVQSVSEQVNTILGYSPHEFIANSRLWFEIIHPTDKEKVRLSVRSLAKGRPLVPQAYRMKHKLNGRYLWFEDTIVPEFDDEGRLTGLSGALHDITEHKRIERMLLEREEQYRILAENIVDVIWVLDLETGRFRFISPSIKRLRGYTIEEALNQKPEDTMTPTSWKNLSDVMPDRLAEFKRGVDKHYTDEIEQYCKDGSTIWVEVSSHFVKNKETNHLEVFGSSRNISKRKTAEQSLIVTLSKYKTLFDSFPLGITVCDRAGNIVETNSVAEKLLGISREEQLQRQIDGIEWRIIHADGTSMQNNEYPSVRALHERKIVENVEMGIVKPSGMTTWLSVTASPIEHGDLGAVITYSDISERKKNEAEIASQALMLSKINDAVVAVDEKQRIVYWNNKAAELYGWNSDEVHGKPSAEILQTNFLERSRQEVIEDILKNGAWRGRVTQRRRNGEDFGVEASTFGLRNEKGELTGFVSVNRDITQQLRYEELLREHTSRYKALIEQAGEAYFVHDFNGKFIDVNQRACESLGYTREELLQMTVMDVERDFDLEGAQREWAKIEPEVPFTLFGHQQRKNGSVFPVKVRFGKFDWKGESVFLGLVRDITEEEETKKTLAIRNELFELTGTIAKIGGWEFDPNTLAGSWSDEVARIHDLEPGAAIDVKKGIEYYTPESRPLIEHAVTALIQEGTPYDLELEIDTAKGRRKYIRTAGQPTYEDGKLVKVRGILQDLTEQKSIRDANKELETRFQTLFEHMIEGFALCKILYEGDTPVDYIHVNVNPAFEQLTGLKNVVGKKISEVIPGLHQDSPELLATYSRVAKNGVPERFENYVSALDQWFSISVYSPQRGFVVIVFDNITSQKKAEEQLRKTVIELERSNKELERYAYVTSHDLQEPLRAMTAIVQLLKRRTENKLDDHEREYIHHIVDASERMQLLINDLLAFSRINRNVKAFQLVAMEMVFKKAQENLSLLIAENKAKLTCEALPAVIADSTQMLQVFQNLISNAIKFKSTKSPEIHIRAEDDGAYWKFSVSDNGIGIEPQYFERIFILFQRLHTVREYSGTGIGLAICQKIVEHHGGNIWVESEPGKGSTFHFTILKRRVTDVESR